MLLVSISHFNSHAHVERDALKFYNDKTTLNFNSHAHVERDGRRKNSTRIKKISTHTLTWSVTLQVSTVSAIFTFQLTRSRGAWQSGKSPCLLSRTFQLTRSRGAWPVGSSSVGSSSVISTHTLTWSVTLSSLCQMIYLKHFNSHAHVERDEICNR